MNNTNYQHAILIRTYKRPDLLKKCLASLEKQSFKKFNVYICDDSMSEINKQVIEIYKLKLNIFYFKNSRQLKYSSMTFNEVLSKVKFERFISILDDDDLWDDDRMMEVNKHTNMGYRWVTHYYKFTTNTSLKEYDNVIFKHKMIVSKKDIIPNSSKYFGAPSFHTVDKEIFKKIGNWDESFHRGPCQEWFTRARLTGYKCFVIKKSLGTYLMNEKSITLNGSKDSFVDEIDTRLKFIRKYYNFFSIFKIILTSYSSAMLKNSFISNEIKGDNIKSFLYLFFLKLMIIYKKYLKT